LTAVHVAATVTAQILQQIAEGFCAARRPAAWLPTDPEIFDATLPVITAVTVHLRCAMDGAILEALHQQETMRQGGLTVSSDAGHTPQLASQDATAPTANGQIGRLQQVEEGDGDLRLEHVLQLLQLNSGSSNRRVSAAAHPDSVTPGAVEVTNRLLAVTQLRQALLTILTHTRTSQLSGAAFKYH
jgi:hypothetical protein